MGQTTEFTWVDQNVKGVNTRNRYEKITDRIITLNTNDSQIKRRRNAEYAELSTANVDGTHTS